MKTYDEVFTFQNLYNAHRKARLSKRNKKEVINFELDLGNNLWKLKKEIDNRTYKIKSYHNFMIYEPKKRKIEALSYSDRVLQHCLVDNYLMEILEKHLIYDNGACRRNKGTDFCRNRIRTFLTSYCKQYYNLGYILQFDIHHYFESIKHDVLKEKLNKIIKEKEILNLLYTIIDSYSDYFNSGLPIGNQTSQCFALYYLDNIDRLIKEKYKIKYYSRYMDDGIIICDNKYTLQCLLKEIKTECEKQGLSLNSTKTRIYKLKEGFTYLGFRFNIGRNGKILMRLPKVKKKRINKYLKTIDEKEINQRIIFYKDYLLKGNNYNYYKYIKGKNSYLMNK